MKYWASRRATTDLPTPPFSPPMRWMFVMGFPRCEDSNLPRPLERTKRRPRIRRVITASQRPSHDLKYRQQRAAARNRVFADLPKPLRIGTATLRIALADTAAILLGQRRNDFEENPATFGRVRIEHVLFALTVDDGRQRIA